MSTETGGFNLLAFRGKMKVLHMSWMAFFVTFVVWFNHAPLMSAIKDTLGLSKAEISTLLTLNVALAIPARIIIGMLTDKFGPRQVYSILLLVCSVPCFAFALADSFAQAAIARFLLGFIGAGFVRRHPHGRRVVPCQRTGPRRGRLRRLGQLRFRSRRDVPADVGVAVRRRRWLALRHRHHRGALHRFRHPLPLFGIGYAEGFHLLQTEERQRFGGDQPRRFLPASGNEGTALPGVGALDLEALAERRGAAFLRRREHHLRLPAGGLRLRRLAGMAREQRRVREAGAGTAPLQVQAGGGVERLVLRHVRFGTRGRLHAAAVLQRRLRAQHGAGRLGGFLLRLHESHVASGRRFCSATVSGASERS